MVGSPRTRSLAPIFPPAVQFPQAMESLLKVTYRVYIMMTPKFLSPAPISLLVLPLILKMEVKHLIEPTKPYLTCLHLPPWAHHPSVSPQTPLKLTGWVSVPQTRWAVSRWPLPSCAASSSWTSLPQYVHMAAFLTYWFPLIGPLPQSQSPPYRVEQSTRVPAFPRRMFSLVSITYYSFDFEQAISLHLKSWSWKGHSNISSSCFGDYRS